jgi:hypothetical protein
MLASKMTQAAQSDSNTFRPMVDELISQLCSLTKTIDDEDVDLPSLATDFP